MYHPHYAHHHHHHHHHRRRALSENDATNVNVAANASGDHTGETSSPAVPISEGHPPTRRSHGDALRFERADAHRASTAMHTGDVLARVVQALGAIGQQPAFLQPQHGQQQSSHYHQNLVHTSTGGSISHARHGLSDSQILADELRSVFSPSPPAECPTPPARPRLRAASEWRPVVCGSPSFSAARNRRHHRSHHSGDYRHLHRHDAQQQQQQLRQRSESSPYEWTWTGTQAQINELREARYHMNRPSYDLPHKQNSLAVGQTSISIEISPPSPAVSHLAAGATSRKHSDAEHHHGGIGLSCLPFNPPPEARRYLDATAQRDGRSSHRRSSALADALRAPYLNAAQRGRPSVFGGIERGDEELLERTTIADLIRAIEVAHIQEQVPEVVQLLLAERPDLLHVGKPESGEPAGRRASLFPGFHSELKPGEAGFVGALRRSMSSLLLPSIRAGEAPTGAQRKSTDDDDNNRSSGDDEESDDEGPAQPPTSALFHNHQHQRARRASMFPANYKSFKRLTDTILSDAPVVNVIDSPEINTAPLIPAPLINTAAVADYRRASMCPPLPPAFSPQASMRRGPNSLMPPSKSAHQQHHHHQYHNTGRRVSLIPGAGRRAIPERLLREYAHVPHETHALSRQHHQRASGREARQFLSAPIGEANGTMTTTSATAASGARGHSRQPSGGSGGASRVGVSPLARAGSGSAARTASSPHLATRRDSMQPQPQQQQQQLAPQLPSTTRIVCAVNPMFRPSHVTESPESSDE